MSPWRRSLNALVPNSSVNAGISLERKILSIIRMKYFQAIWWPVTRTSKVYCKPYHPWLGRILQTICFAQSEARNHSADWNWRGKTPSLRAPHFLYNFSLLSFPAVSTFSCPNWLPLGFRRCSKISTLQNIMNIAPSAERSLHYQSALPWWAQWWFP